MLLLVPSGTLVTSGGRLLIAPLLPATKETLSISAAAAGFALTLMWAMTAINRFVGGRAADSWSQKPRLL